MIIDTGDLAIRPFRTSDHSAVLAYMSDPDTTHYLPGGCLTASGVESFITGNRASFAICPNMDAEPLGHLDFHPWFGDHTWEIGWVIAPDRRRQGLAYRAASAAIEHGFTVLGLHRIIATCQPENRPSHRLMEKLGMRREGHFIACIPRDDGTWWDEYAYALLQSEYAISSRKDAT